jgi:hypothetical protein
MSMCMKSAALSTCIYAALQQGKRYFVTLVDAPKLEPILLGQPTAKLKTWKGWDGGVSRSDRTGT